MMTYVVVSFYVLVLTFSYSILKVVLERIPFITQKLVDKYTIYVWAIAALLVTFFVQDSYVYQIPLIDWKIIVVCVVVLSINLLVAKYAGYHPVGKYNIVNFVVFYPIFEEIIFRGLILSILNGSFHYYLGDIAFLPITTATVISAFLFAIAHLQYYQLNQASIRFMVFACIGGLIFGAITDYTNSIWLPIVLHISFNFLAAYPYIKND